MLVIVQTAFLINSIMFESRGAERNSLIKKERRDSALDRCKVFTFTSLMLSAIVRRLVDLALAEYAVHDDTRCSTRKIASPIRRSSHMSVSCERK